MAEAYLQMEVAAGDTLHQITDFTVLLWFILTPYKQFMPRVQVHLVQTLAGHQVNSWITVGCRQKVCFSIIVINMSVY